jgi:protein-S-isoprenylcysteine O-methyltransferase Ste14
MDTSSQLVAGTGTELQRRTSTIWSTLLGWDLVIGTWYARLAGVRLARLVGTVLAAAALTVLLMNKLLPVAGAGSREALTLNTWPVFIDQALQIPFLLLAILLVVVRRRSLSDQMRLSGLVAALVGTLAPSLLVYGNQRGADRFWALPAALLLVVGMAWAIWSLSALGRCFSVVPEARGLVTSGPYRWVRHPVYLGEIIAALGLLLPIISVFHVMVFVVFCLLQIWRTRHEEAALEHSFPEYAAYRSRTSRLLPGLL